jgi:hypothetical protein
MRNMNANSSFKCFGNINENILLKLFCFGHSQLENIKKLPPLILHYDCSIKGLMGTEMDSGFVILTYCHTVCRLLIIPK